MPHAADALIALGGAFLVCGLLARGGVRLGLPTVPLFMLAGIVFGPNTAGLDLVERPARPRARGPARPRLPAVLPRAGVLPRPARRRRSAAGRRGRRSTSSSTSAAACVYGFALGWGTAEAFVRGRRRRHLLDRDRDQAARRDRAGSATGRPASSSGSRSIEDIFLAFYLALLQPVLGGADGPTEALVGIATAFLFLVAARRGRPLRLAAWVGRLVDTNDEEIVVIVVRRPGDHHRRRGRGARGLRRDRRVHGRAHPRRDREGGPAAHAHPPAARRLRGDLLLPLRADHQPGEVLDGPHRRSRSPS